MTGSSLLSASVFSVFLIGVVVACVAMEFMVVASGVEFSWVGVRVTVVSMSLWLSMNCTWYKLYAFLVD